MKGKQITIGYIAHPYEESHASGMGYSVLEVLRQLAKRAGPYTLVVYSSVPIDRMRVPGAYTNTLIPKGLLRQFFYFLFLKDDIDALFFVAPLLPLWLPRRIKPILMCKELTTEHMRPKSMSGKFIAFVRDRVLMPRAINRAWRVGVSSEATLADIHKVYPNISHRKLKVVFEGYQDWRLFDAAAEEAWESMLPFFFFAGRVKGRKNVHGIVEAFIRYKERVPTKAKLVIAGGYGGEYFKQLQEKLAAHALTNDVFFLGYVTGGHMNWLYAHARAFVFPSLVEGFGMPLIEAMSYGVPCVTSKNSPMEEIAAGAAVLVDPYSIDDISQGMECIFTDDTLREQCTTLGYERAKRYSWDKTGEAYMRLLQELL